MTSEKDKSSKADILGNIISWLAISFMVVTIFYIIGEALDFQAEQIKVLESRIQVLENLCGVPQTKE